MKMDASVNEVVINGVKYVRTVEAQDFSTLVREYLGKSDGCCTNIANEFEVSERTVVGWANGFWKPSPFIRRLVSEFIKFGSYGPRAK